MISYSLSFICLVSVFVCVYPIIGIVGSRFKRKSIYPLINYTQPVSIVVAAYNEEKFIRNKTMALLRERDLVPGSELIIISAGSTDNTSSILREFEGTSGLKIIVLKNHLPKTKALNKAVMESSRDILVFSDCRQDIQPSAVKKLVAYFHDPSIGAVNCTIRDTKDGGDPSIFRRALNFICLNDSVYSSSLNIHGALYAQRRELFQVFPEDIIHDDLFAAVSTISQGKRLVQAKDVIVTDIHFHSYYNKSRIERLVIGLLVFITCHWRTVLKMPLEVRLRFFIYKYLKLVLPLPFLTLIIFGVYYSVIHLPGYTLLASMLFLMVILIFKKFRALIFLSVRVTMYFLSAFCKFLILKQTKKTAKVNWLSLSRSRPN